MSLQTTLDFYAVSNSNKLLGCKILALIWTCLRMQFISENYENPLVLYLNYMLKYSSHYTRNNN